MEPVTSTEQLLPQQTASSRDRVFSGRLEFSLAASCPNLQASHPLKTQSHSHCDWFPSIALALSNLIFTVFSSEAPNVKGMWTCQSESRVVPQRLSGGWNTLLWRVGTKARRSLSTQTIVCMYVLDPENKMNAFRTAWEPPAWQGQTELQSEPMNSF